MSTPHEFTERAVLRAKIEKIMDDKHYVFDPDLSAPNYPCLVYHRFENKLRCNTAKIDLPNNDLPTKDSFVALFSYNGGSRVSCICHKSAEDFVNHFANSVRPVVDSSGPRVRVIQL